MSRPDGGFTLLEILVALVVLGFLMLGLSQGTRYGLQALTAQGRLLEERAELDAVDRALRRLIERMDPGGPNQAPDIQGGRTTLAFTSELPAAAAGAAGLADVALMLNGSRLVLRWAPRINAERFAPPPAPAEAELLRGVQQLDLAYWRRATNDNPASGWTDAWSEQALPELVRIRLVFPSGDRRRWPDIVAAPLRERPVP